MNKYTFTKGEKIVVIEAHNYREALESLAFKVGGDEEAAGYIYQG